MTADEIFEIKAHMERIANILLNSNNFELSAQGARIFEIAQTLTVDVVNNILN